MKKVIYISDQKFYISNNKKWYTTASFPNELIDVFGDIDEWIFFGRLYEIENTDKLYEIKCDERIIKLTFIGIWEASTGFKGYIRNLCRYLKLLTKYIGYSDIIYLKFSFITSYIAGIISSFKNKVLITHMVGDIECIKLIKRNFFINTIVRIQKKMYKLIVRKADLQIYVSEYLMNKYMEGRARAVVMNENRFKEENIISLQKINRRKEGETFKLLFVGRISPEKGLVDVIKALDESINVTIDIIGSGSSDYIQDLKNIIGDKGLHDRIHFSGYTKWGEELFSKFPHYHSLILPSYSEGLPLVIIEAMSMGLPVIASNVGGIPEIITHGENGLLFLPGNVSSITDTIELIKLDENLRQKFIINGLKTAHKHSLENQLKILKKELISIGARME